MLKDILEFFKKEKIYAFLFVALLGGYGFLLLREDKSKDPREKEKAQVLDQFKKAEDRVQAKVKNLGSFEAYLKDRPALAVGVNIFSFIVILAMIAGIVLNYRMIVRPDFRARFHLDRAPPAVNWKVSLLFKFFIWFFASNIVLGFILAGFRALFPVDENLFILLHTTGAEIMSFLVIYSILKKNGGTLADIGLRIPEGKWFREMRIGWTSYLAVLPMFGIVLLLLLAITEIFHYEPPPHPLVSIFLEEGDHSKGLVIYSIALAVFFGPIFEEIFFRGFCYPVLKNRFGSVAAMVITSSFFAFIHDSTFAFWPIFILGMSLNYIYEKRGSLIPNITLHITHNALFLAYFFLAKEIIGRELGG